MGDGELLSERFEKLRQALARGEQLLDPQAEVCAMLAPAERIAYVLHDVLAVPLEEVAGALGRTPTATRQLASRARRRVESPEQSLDAERTVHDRVVDAFLTALRIGDLDELVWLLHPDAALHEDTGPLTPDALAAGALAEGAVAGDGETGIAAAGGAETRGAPAVAEAFADRARCAAPALLDGFAAAVRSGGDRPEVVFGFTVVDGRVAEIELMTDPELLARLDLDTGGEPGSASP